MSEIDYTLEGKNFLLQSHLCPLGLIFTEKGGKKEIGK